MLSFRDSFAGYILLFYTVTFYIHRYGKQADIRAVIATLSILPALTADIRAVITTLSILFV